jgi:hypothetical protein
MTICPTTSSSRRSSPGTLLDAKEKHKSLPGDRVPGFGAVVLRQRFAFEVTRADERHDRVDVVTRGFLGPDRGVRPLPRP